MNRSTALLGAACCALAALPAAAQPYEIVSYTIDGGGGTISAGQYTLSGTIGQPDASGPLTAGPYTLTGGFWPTTIVAGSACIADVTTTGATIPGQVGFGDPDGVADLDDLGYFLNFWLISDPEADVTTTGATLEGQPGFGAADGVVDLDDLGYFLNFWLGGCP